MSFEGFDEEKELRIELQSRVEKEEEDLQWCETMTEVDIESKEQR